MTYKLVKPGQVAQDPVAEIRRTLAILGHLNGLGAVRRNKEAKDAE